MVISQVNCSELRELLQEAIEKDEDFVKEILKEVLHEFLEMERDNYIGVVNKHIRNEEKRLGTRNGYKDRQLNPRMGKLSLKKFQIREYSFNTKLFDNYQRSEKVLLAAIQQMVIDGVSTRNVQRITKELSGEFSFSKSTVSRLIKELDLMIIQWRKRQLKNHYEYLISNACYFYVRENKKVVNMPMLITIGINSNGYREILGADMAVSESEDKKTIRYIKRLVGLDLLDDIQISISTPNPGIPMYKELKNKKFLNTSNFSNFDGDLNSVVNYPHYPANQIVNMKSSALKTRDRETLKRKFKDEKLLVWLKNLYRKYGAIKLVLKLFKRLCSELKFTVSLTRLR